MNPAGAATINWASKEAQKLPHRMEKLERASGLYLADPSPIRRTKCQD